MPVPRWPRDTWKSGAISNDHSHPFPLSQTVYKPENQTRPSIGAQEAHPFWTLKSTNLLLLFPLLNSTCPSLQPPESHLCPH